MRRAILYMFAKHPIWWSHTSRISYAVLVDFCSKQHALSQILFTQKKSQLSPLNFIKHTVVRTLAAVQGVIPHSVASTKAPARQTNVFVWCIPSQQLILVLCFNCAVGRKTPKPVTGIFFFSNSWNVENSFFFLSSVCRSPSVTFAEAALKKIDSFHFAHMVTVLSR